MLSAGLLWYALRGLDWSEVSRLVVGARVDHLFLAAILGSVGLGLRAVRWGVLLRASAPVHFGRLFRAIAAGNFANACLPRTGEIARAIVYGSRHGTTPAYVLATVVAERLADTLAILALAVAGAVAAPQQAEWLRVAAAPLAMLGFVCCVALLGAGRVEAVARVVLDRLPIAPGLRSRALEPSRQIGLGLSTLQDVRRAVAFATLSVVIWGVDIAATLLIGTALRLAVPLPAACLLIAALGLTSVLPATPGYVGLYQFAAVMTLGPFGLSRADAIAFILVFQAVTLVVFTAWGAIGLAHARGH
jgi:uncharacterized protein (TIRG00374 family)